MYVCNAYRWGWLNGHRYMIYAGPDETKALALAAAECSDRGGKYGCEVLKVDADGTEYERIAYWGSSYGEDEPDENRRLDYLQSIGLLLEEWTVGGKVLLPDPSDTGRLIGTEVEPAPQWMLDEVKRKAAHAELVDKIFREAVEKAKAAKDMPK